MITGLVVCWERRYLMPEIQGGMLISSEDQVASGYKTRQGDVLKNHLLLVRIANYLHPRIQIRLSPRDWLLSSYLESIGFSFSKKIEFAVPKNRWERKLIMFAFVC